MKKIGISGDIPKKKNNAATGDFFRRPIPDNETLIQELFHRTNNNMQVIQAMMIIHAGTHPDTTVPEFTDLMIKKINVMAMVYRKLAAAKDLSLIDLGEYLTELAQFVRDGYPDPKKLLTFQFNLRNIRVPFDIAVPLGLTVHELISYAFETAVLSGKRGELKITLKKNRSGMIELRIGGQGTRGMKDFDGAVTANMELQLVQSIIEGQLKGSIEKDRRDGQTLLVRFKDDQYSLRV